MSVINKVRYVALFLMRHMVDAPKTIYFNLRVLPLRQAIKLPIWIAYNTKLHAIHRGNIVIEGHCAFAMIQFGIWGIGGIAYERCPYIFFGPERNNRLVFSGPARFGKGSALTVDKGATIRIGGNFSANNNFQIYSHCGVEIGRDVMVGWNVHIMDSDNHTIIVNGTKVTTERQVVVGNHVWIGAEVDILKGSFVPDYSIVGYRSLVTREFTEANCIIAGSPARIIEQNAEWDV